MLNKSKVVFNQENHTYHLGEICLSGVTSLLSRTLFKDKYGDVPEFILERAAERGSKIHEECELADDIGIIPESQEAKNYLRLCKDYELDVVASEYLISDNLHYASSIDKVFFDGEDFLLGDIKTTYKLDTESVRWQLSIYAYLFELQNPNRKVVGLFAIYLRDDVAKIVDVERIDDSIIKKLMQADIEGKPFENPFEKDGKELAKKFSEMELSISDIIEKQKYYSDRLAELKEGLMKEMVSAGVYSWKGEKVSITRRKDSITKRFDSKAFKEDYPELYDQYLKDSTTQGGITFKI